MGWREGLSTWGDFLGDGILLYSDYGDGHMNLCIMLKLKELETNPHKETALFLTKNYKNIF